MKLEVIRARNGSDRRPVNRTIDLEWLEFIAGDMPASSPIRTASNVRDALLRGEEVVAVNHSWRLA